MNIYFAASSDVDRQTLGGYKELISYLDSQGHSVIQSIFGSISTTRECAECYGKGEIPKEICADCRGEGIKHTSEEIKVHIPSGISDGEMIRMTGKGEAVSRVISTSKYTFKSTPHLNVKG